MATHPDDRRIGALAQTAYQAMQAYGFLFDFSFDALRVLETMLEVDRVAESPGTADLCHLLWEPIENDDSLNLNQVKLAEVLMDTQVNVLVAVADVAAIVRKNSAIDTRAC
jgi:exoribonuclease-2